MGVHPILVTLSIVLFINFSVQKNYDWRCTDEFCQDVQCPELPEDCANRSKALIIPSVDPCNCCEHCFLLQQEGEQCVKQLTEPGLPRNMCARGLFCNMKTTCEKMTQEDPYYFENYVCENDRCYCAVLSPNGMVKKIFGQFDKSAINNETKQCACSVVAYKAMTQMLRALPFEDVYQPSARCLENGQFDPLQCIEDRCGCVETDTGIPDENGFMYSVKGLEDNHPHCFNGSRHRKGYYTSCEKKRNQLLKEINEEFWYGKNFIHFRKFHCNPDGNYGQL